MKIILGDEVVVTTGKYKGSKGKVEKSFPSENRLLVSGVNIVKKHRKADASGSAAIVEVERPIHISNVSLIDPQSGKASKVGYKFDSNGKKVRFYRKSSEVIA
jgi:large subunit ribosomal protein L24